MRTLFAACHGRFRPLVLAIALLAVALPIVPALRVDASTFGGDNVYGCGYYIAQTATTGNNSNPIPSGLTVSSDVLLTLTTTPCPDHVAPGGSSLTYAESGAQTLTAQTVSDTSNATVSKTLTISTPGTTTVTSSAQNPASGASYQSASASYTVTIDSGAATVVSSPSATTLNEGDTLTGAITIRAPNTISSVAVDYGDGAGYQAISPVNGAYSLDHTYDNDSLSGPYEVLVKVTSVDSQNATHTGYGYFPITVNETAPTATLSVPSSVTAGQSFTATMINGSDPSGQLHYFTLCGGPYFPILLSDPDVNVPSATCTADYTTPCEGQASGSIPDCVAAEGYVIDNDNNFNTYYTTIPVTNVPPSATFSGATIDPGQGASLSFSNATDPSAYDTNAGFHYAYDCTGQAANLALTYTSAGTSAAQSCAGSAFPQTGTYPVAGRIYDVHDGYRDYSATVTARQLVALNSQPSGATEGSPITLTGTCVDDAASGGATTLRATVNGLPVGTIADTTSAFANQCGSDGQWTWTFTPSDETTSDLVEITETDAYNGTSNVAFRLTVNDAPLSVAPGATVSCTLFVPCTGTVATFSDSNTNCANEGDAAPQYLANLQRADGSSGAGAISSTGTCAFSVADTHTYSTSVGSSPVQVNVKDEGGSSGGAIGPVSVTIPTTSNGSVAGAASTALCAPSTTQLRLLVWKNGDTGATQGYLSYHDSMHNVGLSGLQVSSLQVQSSSYLAGSAVIYGTTEQNGKLATVRIDLGWKGLTTCSGYTVRIQTTGGYDSGSLSLGPDYAH